MRRKLLSACRGGTHWYLSDCHPRRSQYRALQVVEDPISTWSALVTMGDDGSTVSGAVVKEVTIYSLEVVRTAFVGIDGLCREQGPGTQSCVLYPHYPKS